MTETDTATLAHLDRWLASQVRDDDTRAFVRSLMLAELGGHDHEYWLEKGWPALFKAVDGWTAVAAADRLETKRDQESIDDYTGRRLR